MAKKLDRGARETRSVAEQIRQDMEKFSPAEKRAAHLLLSHYPFVGLETVAAFASRAGISAPSALQFVSRLGFSGFPEFQKHLRQELEAQLLPPLAKSSPRTAARKPTPLAGFADAVVANLHTTVGTIATAEFENVVALIADPRRRIHFTGGRFTRAIAQYAESHFRIVRSHVGMIDAQPASWRDRMIEINRKDVIVVFDIRRYQDDVIALAETAAKQGATVILLTDQWLSPVARVARHILPARVTVPSNWDSSAGLLLIVEALVAVVTKRLWKTAKPRMEAIEKLRARAR